MDILALGLTTAFPFAVISFASGYYFHIGWVKGISIFSGMIISFISMYVFFISLLNDHYTSMAFLYVPVLFILIIIIVMWKKGRSHALRRNPHLNEKAVRNPFL